jgi:hypothetical protein
MSVCVCMVVGVCFSTYFKKYCSPILRRSKNLGRNFETMPFGGNGGMDAAENGKVIRRFRRSVSNSEYRFRKFILLPLEDSQLRVPR